MLYDNNLIFSEEFDIAGVSAGIVGDVKDMEVINDISAGQPLSLEIECLERPVGTGGYFSFLLVMANDATLFTDSITIAQSPIYGSLLHLAGVQPYAGTRSRISLAGGIMGSGSNTKQYVNNTVYGRSHLGVYFVNHSYTLTSGATGTMSAGMFALRLTIGAESYGRIYPGALS